MDEAAIPARDTPFPGTGATLRGELEYLNANYSGAQWWEQAFATANRIASSYGVGEEQELPTRLPHPSTVLISGAHRENGKWIGRVPSEGSSIPRRVLEEYGDESVKTAILARSDVPGY